jgi:hypothetical protein
MREIERHPGEGRDLVKGEVQVPATKQPICQHQEHCVCLSFSVKHFRFWCVAREGRLLQRRRKRHACERCDLVPGEVQPATKDHGLLMYLSEQHKLRL